MNEPSLFGPGPETQTGPDVFYEPRAFADMARSLEALVAAMPLEAKTCVMYGKTLDVPRLECWFGDRPYRFGGRTEFPKPWPAAALALRSEVEFRSGARFDSCFVNFYRDQNDCIGWHADDDDWIGPVIASVSFGAPRRFVMREKASLKAIHESDSEAAERKGGLKAEWLLGDGDLFVMRAGVQRAWQHTVPRQKAHCGPRLNFTFRQTVSS